MSNVAVAGVSTDSCLLNMPCEILFEIFRNLPKGKLCEISKLCPKFRDVAADTRLWKDVYIKYEKRKNGRNDYFAFEELYSEQWRVKVIDLSFTKIKRPVSSEIDQVVKVEVLKLRDITADKATRETILAKYQCTELCLDYYSELGYLGHFLGIAPEAFSKQTALEVLSLKGLRYINSTIMNLLVPVLSHCKSLKTLNLSYNNLSNLDMLDFVKNLPKSLEKLYLGNAHLEDSFFQLLAGSTPNLRELELGLVSVECPSLLKFQVLEALHICSYHRIQDMSDLCMFLIKLPALKTVYINPQSADGETLKKTLEPHGIMVRKTNVTEWSPYPGDGNLWRVSYYDV